MFGKKKSTGREEEKKNVLETAASSEAVSDMTVPPEVSSEVGDATKNTKRKPKKDEVTSPDASVISEKKLPSIIKELATVKEKSDKPKKGLFGFLKKKQESTEPDKPLSMLPDEGPALVIGPEESKKNEQSDPLLFLTPQPVEEAAVLEKITQGMPKNLKSTKGEKVGNDDLVQTILTSAIDSKISVLEGATPDTSNPSNGAADGILMLKKATFPGAKGDAGNADTISTKTNILPLNDGKSKSGLLLSLEDEIKQAKVPQKPKEELQDNSAIVDVEPVVPTAPVAVDKKHLFGFLKKKKAIQAPFVPPIPQISASQGESVSGGAIEQSAGGNPEVTGVAPIESTHTTADPVASEKPVRNPISLYRDLGIPEAAPKSPEPDGEPILGLQEKLTTNAPQQPLEEIKTKDGNQLVSAIIATAKKSQEEKNKVLGADFTNQIKKDEDEEEEKRKAKLRKKAKHLLASRFVAGVSLMVPLCSWIVFSSYLSPSSSFSEILNSKNYGAEFSGVQANKDKKDAELKKITDEIAKLKQETESIKDNKILKEVMERRVDFLEIMLRINKITLKALNLTPELNSAIHMLTYNSYSGSIDANEGIKVSISGQVRDPKRLSMSKVTQIIESINSDEYLDGAALRSFSKSADDEGSTVSSFNLTLIYHANGKNNASPAPEPVAKKKKTKK